MKYYDNEPSLLAIRVATVAADDVANASSYALAYTDTEGATQTLASGSDVLTLLTQMRGSAKVILTGSEELTKTQILAMTRGLFTEWWNRRKDTYGWLDESLRRTDYDPLENYDRKEEGGWKDDHDIASATDTTTSTPRAVRRRTSTPGVVITTENETYGDNSSTEVPAAKMTVTPDATTPDIVEEGGVNGTDTVQTVRGAHKDTDTRLYQNYRVHGNIGVSTVADMLGKEVELRRPIDLVKFALNEWLDLYTTYIE